MVALRAWVAPLGSAREPRYDAVAAATRDRPDLVIPVRREGDEHPFLALERDFERGPTPVTALPMKHQRAPLICLPVRTTLLVVQTGSTPRPGATDPLRRDRIGVPVQMASGRIPSSSI